MFNWSDLRHLIAVSRHGSTLAAAKAFGVNQSTVHRRLAEMEHRIGLTLVLRLSTGYRLSELGETLLDRVSCAICLAARTSANTGRSRQFGRPSGTIGRRV